VVRAVVVAAGSTTEDELLEHCHRHLVAYKCPGGIDFVDELPRTEIGKLLRRQIRDRYWAGRERQI
jgi:long-chain acyl-CoA synthetase